MLTSLALQISLPKVLFGEIGLPLTRCVGCKWHSGGKVGVLYIVENLSHPSGREFCFRMREVPLPDPRICNPIARMAVQSLHRIEIPTAICTPLVCIVLCRTERIPISRC